MSVCRYRLIMDPDDADSWAMLCEVYRVIVRARTGVRR